MLDCDEMRSNQLVAVRFDDDVASLFVSGECTGSGAFGFGSASARAVSRCCRVDVTDDDLSRLRLVSTMRLLADCSLWRLLR